VQACRPFLNPDSRVLELGCSTGDLLGALNPAYGVGIDISPAMISVAQENYPDYEFICADVEHLPNDAPLDAPFDIIIMADLVGYIEDIEVMFLNLHKLTHSGTRIIISHWNWIWQPILQVGETLRLKAPDLNVRHNWLSSDTIINLLELADYDTVQSLAHLLLPVPIPMLAPFVNVFSQSPIFNRLGLLKTVIARPVAEPPRMREASVTVVIPTRNEVDNIVAAIKRTPQIGSHTELLFIDGNSTDGTVEKIQEQIAAHPEKDIKFVPQVPPQSPDADTPPDLMLKLGKGDAVRKAFDAASCEVLMILDSDLTVPPEELPKFYRALVSGKGRMINGTRFVYEQEAGAMPPLNKMGNVFFSKLFSRLMSQPVTDTLCGTKVLYKQDYEAIKANRSYFGDFDPFGDFDLLFGAARLNHRILEVPVHYRARSYGDSKVRVGMHGPLLARMSWIGLWKFKILPLITFRRRPKAAPSRRPDDPPPEAATTTRPILLVVIASAMVALWQALKRGNKE
jgi:glycosyltransferase involved in cell wall biosynthesis/SAM-dependent methyltransferase